MSTAPYSAIFFEDQFFTKADAAAARVSICDSGYLLGEGVFATLRAYDGVCFRADRHIRALARGAETFGIDMPASQERLREIADHVARLSGAADAYVRLTLTRGAARAPGILSALARASELPTDDDYARGIPVAIVSPRRIPAECMDPTFKTTSYAPSVLARKHAERVGARDGLQLAVDGSLACATMANVFLFMGDALYTPSLASGCRPGVTREAVLEIAKARGLRVREERVDPAALADADEAFLTSTRVECLPIASVDGRAVGRAPYARTHALRDALRRVIQDETRPHRPGTR